MPNLIDKDRILSKIDEMDSYLEELEEVKPKDIEDYKNSINKKRACERLLQISIEAIIDICNIIVSNLKLGLPSDEEDLFNKLEKKKIISSKSAKILIDMKSFRNILVHKYGVVDDELVFEMIDERLGDFNSFKKEILLFLEHNIKNI